MANDDAIDTLNHLVAIAKDGVNGMSSAAEHAKSGQLKSTLQKLSQDRSRLASELQEAVRDLGGDPDKSGTTLGAIHRGWMNLKEAVSIADDSSLIEECERGEDVAVKEFRDALGKPLPAQAQQKVQSCFQQVKKSHDQIRQLRNMDPNAGKTTTPNI
jgi:uncharacterized protein (TIGR02284 family)